MMMTIKPVLAVAGCTFVFELRSILASPAISIVNTHLTPNTHLDTQPNNHLTPKNHPTPHISSWQNNLHYNHLLLAHCLVLRPIFHCTSDTVQLVEKLFTASSPSAPSAFAIMPESTKRKYGIFIIHPHSW